VRAEFEPSPQGRDRLSTPPAEEVRDPEREVAKGETGAEFNGPLGDEDRLLQPIRKIACAGEESRKAFKRSMAR
jgi:hypothetical protein